MIERSQRQPLALALRRLANGRITCDEFECTRPVRTRDPAVSAIGNYGWSLYSEWDDRLTGRKALPAEEQRRVTRCVLFLNTEQSYTWPSHPRWSMFDPLYIVSGGRFGIGAAAERRWRSTVDWDAWPFPDVSSLRAVAAHWPVARAV